MSEYICPHCKKPIYDDEALLCLWCGENLERGIGVLGKLKYSSLWILTTLLILLVILSFITLLIKQ